MIPGLSMTAVVAFVAAMVCIFTIPDRASLDQHGARAMTGLVLLVIAAVAAGAAAILGLLSLLA